MYDNTYCITCYKTNPHTNIPLKIPKFLFSHEDAIRLCSDLNDDQRSVGTNYRFNYINILNELDEGSEDLETFNFFNDLNFNED